MDKKEDVNDVQILSFSKLSHSKEDAYAFTVIFIENAERKLSLSRRINDDLVELIGRFYFEPEILFHECHSKLKLSEDKKQITGTARCSAYCAFTRLMINDGKSVYRWSLRLVNTNKCYRSVGVVTEADRVGWDKSNFAHWMKYGSTGKDTGTLYFEGHRNDWRIGEVITAELDYGNNTMTLYRTPRKTTKRTIYRECQIEPDESYYFGLLVCADPENKVSVVHPHEL